MTENGPNEQPPQMEVFSQLTYMLANSAMQNLGVPTTPEAEPVIDLPSAQFHIDILEMLGEKTQGNLTPDEHKLLSEVLPQLQMMFVQLKEHMENASMGNAPPPPAPEAPEAPEAPPSEEPAPLVEPASPPPSDEDDGDGDDNEPKFKKTYG